MNVLKLLLALLLSTTLAGCMRINVSVEGEGETGTDVSAFTAGGPPSSRGGGPDRNPKYKPECGKTPHPEPYNCDWNPRCKCKEDTYPDYR